MNRIETIKAILNHYKMVNTNQQVETLKDALVRLPDSDLSEILEQFEKIWGKKSIQLGVR